MHSPDSTMFPPDSYVLRPPTVFKPEDRICMEAATFAMRSAESALHSIRDITVKHDVEREDFSEIAMITLHACSWIVVDQIHALRQLLRTLKIHEEHFSGIFFKRYEAATLMRNAMDHLKDQVGNLARAKKPRPTISGVLSYFKYVGVRPDTANGHYGKVFIVPFGHFLQKQHNFPGVNPAGKRFRRDTTDLFMFSAFDWRLEIYELFDDLPTLANELERTAQTAVALAVSKGDIVPGPDGKLHMEQPARAVIWSDVDFGVITSSAS